MLEKQNKQKLLIAGIAFGVLLAGALAVGFFYATLNQTRKQGPPQDKYVVFLSEVYDVILENYWNSITDEQLANIYYLAIKKIVGEAAADLPKDKPALEKFISEQGLARLDTDAKKKDFSAQLADMVLANLEPFGRSRLYGQKQEIALQNTVENKNPDVDVYQLMGVGRDASLEQIKAVYEQKSAELKRQPTAQTKDKLAQLDQAYTTLSDERNRKTYDETGSEPTMVSKLLRPDIYYIKMSKFSPTMIQELVNVTSKVDTGETLDTLILDLRDNIGGLIDGLPYFLGPFIGNDQYAYQFYQQGQKQDFKTVVGWLPSLVRYKKVVVLVNHNTQSSAEVMAATIKKYNVGLLVGEATRGWGTVEKVFDLNNQIDSAEKYSVLLAHHLTLRDDGQPIEGKGVEPVIVITDSKWEQKLYSYYHYQPLVDEVKKLVKGQ